MKKIDRLFLIDAMAIAYRSYYAFIRQPLINSKGINTSAVYGFVTFLNKILAQEFPEFIAVVFDTQKPTFRHIEYKEYKATRQKMPDDMSAQIPIIKNIVNAYNIPIIEMEGFEADDIIGTLAKQAEKEGAYSFLVTPDKDFMQLVSEKTKIYKPGKFGSDIEVVDIESVKEKFGVSPDKVIDVLGLIGDASDNIPGVKGIGEKTAIPLIQKYGSIEEVYNHLNEITAKALNAKLTANKDMAFLSKRLVTIDINVPLDISLTSLQAKTCNKEKLLELFDELEFKSLANKFKNNINDDGIEIKKDNSVKNEIEKQTTLDNIQTTKHNYKLICTEKELDELCNILENSNEFVFDTETTSTDSLNCELVGISFAVKPYNAYFVAIADNNYQPSQNLFESPNNSSNIGLHIDIVFKKLKPIFENSKIKKIGHNIKYDILVLSQYDISVAGNLFDTMIASYVIRSDNKHNMDDLAAQYLSYKTITYNDLVGKGRDKKNIRDVPINELSDYSCEDADITLRLYNIFKDKQDAIKLCNDIEFPLIPVLTQMEINGISIDTKHLQKLSVQLESQINILTREIYNIAETQFNINSTQQLSDILFNKLKLNPTRKTKTGFSTDVSVLEDLSGTHQIIDLLLEYRQATKLKSTYIDALPKLINNKTQRVHTSFNQALATTGRLSSSNPNIQNIPIRTEIGRLIRQAFIPINSDYLILSADYSQIELRIMAHISGDESLIDAFKNKEDIHSSTASKIFGVIENDVSREMRRKAKEVNFGIMYGIGAYGLSKRLNIPQNEAKSIIEKYFERFPKVQKYINDTIAFAKSNGYVSTLLGRKRYFDDINHSNYNVRQNAERQAINMPIQGTAADMIKIAMIKIHNAILKNNLKSKMLLQVHDELVIEMLKTEEKIMRNIIETEMKNALALSVPIEVDIGIGANWLEAH